MNVIEKRPLENLGYGFVPAPYLPDGENEYYIRDRQRRPGVAYRSLDAQEIEILVKNDNTADNWNEVHVTDRFDASLVKGCEFHGLVRIGDLERYFLEFHDLRLPVGIYNSTIIACDIGSNVVIDTVRYLAHYIIGDNVILHNVNEMHTTDHAKFGNGIVKTGEEESVRIWLEVGNENGGRRILPFDGMLPGDAFLWSKYRDDRALMDRFVELTNNLHDRSRGYYGEVGDRSIVKNCRILKDVRVGSDAYIKGANKLKNLTVRSDPNAPTQIGEGVELVNGVIGVGCRIFYGVKAVRFLLGSNSTLKYGARLINSVLGDNSTISCCEVLNSLIFPGHEQHHNNSFLCAATVLGQSNIAAGATIGSNHNSRGSDGEIVAGRGFWPGLCVSLKHNCRFASFTLLVKGAYPAELDVALPFSLVTNNETAGRLDIIPAYWFMYNLYALARNAWKYVARDHRLVKRQRLELDYLAPDTVDEMFTGMRLLELWVGKAARRESGRTVDAKPGADQVLGGDIGRMSERGGRAGEGIAELCQEGRELLLRDGRRVNALTVFGENIESSRRPVLILKAASAWAAYREMVQFYGVRTLLDYLLDHDLFYDELLEHMGAGRRESWVNAGGQLFLRSDVEALRRAVVEGELTTWEDVHREYERLGELYPVLKARHAFTSLLEVLGITREELTVDRWTNLLEWSVLKMNAIVDGTRTSREKDYTNPFRAITYDNPDEMSAVVGTAATDAFINLMRKAGVDYAARVETARARFAGG